MHSHPITANSAVQHHHSKNCQNLGNLSDLANEAIDRFQAIVATAVRLGLDNGYYPTQNDCARRMRARNQGYQKQKMLGDIRCVFDQLAIPRFARGTWFGWSATRGDEARRRKAERVIPADSALGTRIAQERLRQQNVAICRDSDIPSCAYPGSGPEVALSPGGAAIVEALAPVFAAAHGWGDGARRWRCNAKVRCTANALAYEGVSIERLGAIFASFANPPRYLKLLAQRLRFELPEDPKVDRAADKALYGGILARIATYATN